MFANVMVVITQMGKVMIEMTAALTIIRMIMMVTLMTNVAAKIMKTMN